MHHEIRIVEPLVELDEAEVLRQLLEEDLDEDTGGGRGIFLRLGLRLAGGTIPSSIGNLTALTTLALFSTNILGTRVSVSG